MNNLRINKPKITLLFCCMSVFLALGQQKTKHTFSVNKDATVALNTSHVNIRFETWNKNTVEVEVLAESDELSKEELKAYLDSWDLNVTQSGNKVTINSGGRQFYKMSSGQPMVQMPSMDLSALKELEQLGPMLNELLTPILEEIPEITMMVPEGMMKDLSIMQFDYNAYSENPEKYIKEWEKQFEEKFGEDFEKRMEEWSVKIEKKMEEREEAMQKRAEAMEKREGIMQKRAEAMEKRVQMNEERTKEIQERVLEKQKELAERFGEDFELRMEKWGEDFEKRMEVWGANFDENNYENSFMFIKKANPKVKRTIIVRMPKSAILELNVRHGEVKLAENTTNVKANLNYTKLFAGNIEGEKTFITASYAPVTVQTWAAGTLDLKFVDAVEIAAVENIHLKANSSNVYIFSLNSSALINGSFGKLQIHAIGKDFKNLDIILENADAAIKLPQTAFDIFYNGSRSKIKFPEHLDVQVSRSSGSEIIKGFSQKQNPSKSITISARFSDVTLQ